MDQTTSEQTAPIIAHPISAVGLCCRNSADMLQFADGNDFPRAQLNEQQAKLLREAGGIADEMLAALVMVEALEPDTKLRVVIRAAIAKAEGRDA